jgi:hypothetical protein
VYIPPVIFIETQVFMEDIQGPMPDESYAEFQQHLADHPDAGDVIQGTQGAFERYDGTCPGLASEAASE